MDVVFVHTVGGHGLYSLGLGLFLGSQTVAVEHVEKIGVAAGIELIGTLQLDPALGEQIGQRAVNYSSTHLGLDVVTNNGDTGLFKMPCPPSFRIAGDKNRHIVDECQAGLQCAACIKPGRLLGADREIIQEDFRAGFLQHLNDFFFSRFRLIGQDKGAPFVVIFHVVRKPVQNPAHPNSNF